MDITQKFIGYNRPKEPLTPIGAVVHETATPGATAENEFNYFNSANRSASAHAFVDWVEIVQTIPWDEKSWHAGPTANHRFIGIELCRPSEYDEAQFAEVWNRAVWLFAFVFIKILKISNVSTKNLMSHAEVSNLWGESDHQDPIAYFNEYGKTVDDFRNAVQLEITRAKETALTFNDIQGHWAENDILSVLRKGIVAGYEDGSFKPNRSVTRAEAAVIAARIIRYILGD
jgi:N-acetylmuramoyl-L-alanine amidase